jgi:uncharacterized membrane protein YcaP (DUF421 family)
MDEWFGAPWATVAWVAASTTAIYATTIVAVRLAGRRTVAQISAFDVVVTIALGSLVATTAVSRTASYAQGATAVISLLLLQVVVGALRMRFPSFARLLAFHPLPVVRDGVPELSRHPFGPQLTEAELRSKLRQHGVFHLSEVAVVIIEPTGAISYQRSTDGSTNPTG